MAEKKGKPAKKKLYKMPEKLTSGEVLIDIKKVSWVIGGSIGVGGFGEIYVAAKSTEPKKLAYAVKIVSCDKPCVVFDMSTRFYRSLLKTDLCSANVLFILISGSRKTVSTWPKVCISYTMFCFQSMSLRNCEG